MTLSRTVKRVWEIDRELAGLSLIEDKSLIRHNFRYAEPTWVSLMTF